MLFFLKFLSFYCQFFRYFQFLFQVPNLILQLLNVLFYLIILNNFKLLLLLVFNIFQKLKLFLQTINCLVLHLYFILQHVYSQFTQTSTYPKNLLIFIWLWDFARSIYTFKSVCRHLKVIFLYFPFVLVVIGMIVKEKKTFCEIYFFVCLFFLWVHHFVFLGFK